MEEHKTPEIARKLWHIVRVAFFMLKKGIYKRKLLITDLNIMIKHGKVAGKSLGNRLFHHHASTSGGGDAGGGPPDYEFSCSNTPLYRHYFPKIRKHHSPFMMSNFEDSENNNNNIKAVNKVLEMMMLSRNDAVEASPVVLAAGRSPMVDSHVDEAAEEFIKRFYSQLKDQN